MQNHSDFCPVIRELDSGTKFFIWDLDVVCAFFFGFAIGVLLGNLWLGLLLGVFLAKGLTRLKIGRHAGFGLHLLYWYLPYKFFKCLPASHRREFIG